MVSQNSPFAMYMYASIVCQPYTSTSCPLMSCIHVKQQRAWLTRLICLQQLAKLTFIQHAQLLCAHNVIMYIVQSCEYCRHYSAFSECFQVDDEGGCDLCKLARLSLDYSFIPKPTPNDFAEFYPHLLHTGLRSNYLLNSFGQILYSQFQSEP